MMRYKASVDVNGDTDSLFAVFEAEIKGMGGDRAEVSMEKTGNGIRFFVNATDSTALRAHLLGLTKLLTVKEEMDKVGD